MDKAAAEEEEEDGRDVSDNPPSGGEAGEVAVVSAMLIVDWTVGTTMRSPPETNFALKALKKVRFVWNSNELGLAKQLNSQHRRNSVTRHR
jgi:hypothetical protein